MGRIRWQHHVIVGADDAGLRLEKHNRVFRDRRAGFLGVIDVVQTDRHELGWGGDAWTQAGLAFLQGQLFGIELA
jgi:hypothetical protein